MEAVIIIGHGSRSAIGNEKVSTFMEEVLSETPAPIKEYCFFERAEPTIAQAFESCVRKGATKCIAVPFFLLQGYQVNTGITAEIAKVQERYPTMDIQYGTPFGTHPMIFQLLEERLREKGFKNGRDEAVFLIGHGSHDPLSGEEFKKVASEFGKKIANDVYVGYLITEPHFLESIDRIKGEKKKIYFIPYFLYAGYFAQEIIQNTNAYLENNEEVDIIHCEQIGLNEGIRDMLKEKLMGTQQVS